jgi:hypothetical protein
LTNPQDLEEFVEMFEGYKKIASLDYGLIKAMMDELEEAIQRRPRVDASLIRQLNHWKAEAQNWQDAANYIRYQYNR